MINTFTHLDDSDQPAMVDVGDKKVSKRIAKARSIVILNDEILNLLEGEEINTKKGPVYQTAIIAGVMAAKRTSELNQICKPIAIGNCKVNIHINEQKEDVIDCLARTTGKTGVEMEALTGASVAALTIYDMCKAFSHHIVIKETKLMEKTGGKRDFSRVP